MGGVFFVWGVCMLSVLFEYLARVNVGLDSGSGGTVISACAVITPLHRIITASTLRCTLARVARKRWGRGREVKAMCRTSQQSISPTVAHREVT